MRWRTGKNWRRTILYGLPEYKRRPIAGRIRKLYRLRVLADYAPSEDITRKDSRIAGALMADVFRMLKEAYE